jgi:hypothetical protein
MGHKDISDGATKMAQQIQPCERRRSARCFGPFEPDHFDADVGDVLDLSRTGLRARVRWPLRDEYVIMLNQSTSQCLVTGRVRWSRRIGLFTYEVGLEFRDLTEPDLELLRRAIDGESADTTNDDEIELALQ